MRETNPWSPVIATVEAGRRACLLEHFLRLDAATRLQRFCHAADDADLQRYVQRPDFSKGRAIGCFDAGAMRGAAELRPTGAAGSGLFEATFSVEKGWQRRGIGTALVLRTIPVARSIGARQILVDRLGSSDSMRRILARFDCQLLFDGGDWKAWLPLSETARDRSARHRDPCCVPRIRTTDCTPGGCRDASARGSWLVYRSRRAN
jgi:GNAT superfamily N-acetyltransferase